MSVSPIPRYSVGRTHGSGTWVVEYESDSYKQAEDYALSHGLSVYDRQADMFLCGREARQ